MAKSSSKDERKAARKAEKKAAKTGGSGSGAEPTGVTKVKSEKKDKKEKRTALAEKALNEIESGDVKSEEEKSEVDGEDENKQKKPVGALVPFANPLADDKVAKKVFKSVKKAAAHRTLKRGVKEVVKALRKSPAGSTDSAVGVVVLAADISPMDVISHIPVLCEDHGVPYVYVTSRAELGAAGQTKRPTSVVMVCREDGKKGGATPKDDDGESWDTTYKGLVKVVEREGQHVKV